MGLAGPGWAGLGIRCASLEAHVLGTMNSRHPPPETRNQKPETRNPPPETRNQKPETRNPPPETRNQKPETRNQKPETFKPRKKFHPFSPLIMNIGFDTILASTRQTLSKRCEASPARVGP